MSEGYPLFHAETAHAWHHRTSPELAKCARSGALVLLPVYTFTRHKPEWPLDAEEWMGGRVLRQALDTDEAEAGPEDSRFLVLPPLRHCPAQDAGQAFALDLITGSRLLEDLLRSVSQSGFKRVVLLHAHPLLADWLDCVLRDVRLETGLDLYRIGLDGLGLDFLDIATLTQLTACLAEGDEEVNPLVKSAGTHLLSLLHQIERHRFPQFWGDA
ncbi:MAG: creatininase family protein [Verrucomicrobia bacterium]|nr:creatininase family protein [Verrucomicrobiota bacterium]MCH8514274.1 creatininase family protein [Kiritimatiellia bacterium]